MKPLWQLLVIPHLTKSHCFCFLPQRVGFEEVANWAWFYPNLADGAVMACIRAADFIDKAESTKRQRITALKIGLKYLHELLNCG